MSETVWIYGLTDPRTGEVRYVGKTRQTPKEWTEEQKARKRGRKERPEATAKRAGALRGKPKPPRTAEHRRKLSEATRQRWANGAYRNVIFAAPDEARGGEHDEHDRADGSGVGRH